MLQIKNILESAQIRTGKTWRMEIYYNHNGFTYHLYCTDTAGDGFEHTDLDEIEDYAKKLSNYK